MHTDKQIAALLCLVGLMASGTALAQDNKDKGVYVGGSAGQSRAFFDASPPILRGLPATFDNSYGVWKAFGGYQFSPSLSAEVTYVRLGDYTINVATPTGPQFTQARITGWGGALVGTMPLGKNFSLLGRIGETYTRQTRGSCNICAGPVTESSSNVFSLTFGAGIKYDFNPNLSARAEVERFQKVGSDGNTFNGHINLYTAGLAYKF